MSVFASLAKRYHRPRFDRLCREVEQTPPLQGPGRKGLVVLSQTYDADIYMYLVAAKSFARHLMPELFVIVDDGLSAEHQQLIVRQLGNVQFVPRKTVANGHCPAGGCWERLLTVADFCERFDVIQLDSDTVTLRAPEAVVQAVEAGSSFTLSTQQGREFVTVEQASALVSTSASQHIQVVAEKALARIDELAGKAYIRGCAGFTGFARGQLARESVEAFSRTMSSHLGAVAWAQWGSEQFASNFLVANTKAPVALPFEEYPYWAPGMDLSRARLIHFIGDNRFTSGKYANTALSSLRSF